MMNSYILFVIVIFAGIVYAAPPLGISEGGSCDMADNTIGVCILQSQCPFAIELARNERHADIVICSIVSRKNVFVCCPSSGTSRNSDNKRPSEQYCDLIKKTPLPSKLPSLLFHIINGVPAGVREFPHMVAIGYEDSDELIKWRCAGSLVSSRFVITAAHCIKLGIKKVRVGAVSLNTTTGAEKPQEINIKSSLKHPKYLSINKYYDIALLELEKRVDTSTGFARPLCLPTAQSTSSDDKYIVAGWGFVNKTTESNILLKADVNELNLNQCKEKFKHFVSDSYDLENGIVESQVCAENKISKADTCQGDSGSPLFFKNKDDGQYYIFGITSFGLSTQCGLTGETPGVYTRVSSYLEWIEKVVWPGNVINDLE